MTQQHLKQRVSRFLFPSILLVFLALYVTSLASGNQPEVGLLRSGAASLVLAVLGRVALGIIGDEETLAINELALLGRATGGSSDGQATDAQVDPTAATNTPAADASAATDAPTGFIPTPLGSRAGASMVEGIVRGRQLGGQE